jgi:type IX secretion system PorP/SprF family membrane protein
MKRSLLFFNHRIKSSNTFYIGTFVLLMSIVILMSGDLQAQQLPHYSQYIFNRLHINPAYAGYKAEPYVQATYRKQWLNFPGAPTTMNVSADFSANEGMLGFGTIILSDQIGPVRTNFVQGVVAQRIKVGEESFLGLGVSGGVTEHVLDGEMLQGNDPDRIVPTSRMSFIKPNLNAGLFFHNEKVFAGISAFNMVGNNVLIDQDIQLAFNSFHYYLTYGMMFEFSEALSYKPSFLVKAVAGAPVSYDITNLFLLFQKVWVGGSYRSNFIISDNLDSNLSRRNAVVFLTEFYATSNLRIGYSYDHHLSRFNSFQSNTHEISLGFYLKPKFLSMKNPRWF